MHLYKKFLRDHSIAPVIGNYPVDFDTALSIYLKTGSQYLLESIKNSEMIGRYSVIAKGVRRKFVLNKNTLEDWQLQNNKLSCVYKTESEKNPLDYVQKIMKEYLSPLDDLDLPEPVPPFWGGLIGYLGYETVSYFEDIENIHDKEEIAIPDGILVQPSQLLVLDHVNNTLSIIDYIDRTLDVSLEIQYENALNSIGGLWHAISHSNMEDLQNTAMGVNLAPSTVQISELTGKEAFMKKVSHAKECINRGDIIQVVISHQVLASIPGNKELAVYMHLRHINPSPYMYYLNFDDFAIIGSSPETMVKLRGDEITLKPIAGTIRRGRNETEDRDLKQSLLEDNKENAEHLMLVDLGRNDLHRISKPGTVEVKEYMNVESYSHVHHIVSSITGRIEEGKDSFDLIKATFPAGTLTGAPKIEAMNIISRLEECKRKVYGGMILTLGYDGYLDSCIAIRTLVIKDNKAYLQAGCGVVADSQEEKEYEETQAKLGALLNAIGKVSRSSFREGS